MDQQEIDRLKGDYDHMVGALYAELSTGQSAVLWQWRVRTWDEWLDGRPADEMPMVGAPNFVHVRARRRYTSYISGILQCLHIVDRAAVEALGVESMAKVLWGLFERRVRSVEEGGNGGNNSVREGEGEAVSSGRGLAE